MSQTTERDPYAQGEAEDGRVFSASGGDWTDIAEEAASLGEERIVELMRLQGLAQDAGNPDVYLVLAGPAAEAAGLGLAERIRDGVPGLRVEANCGGGSFKSQLKRADKSGARMAVIVGDDEAGDTALRDTTDVAVRGAGRPSLLRCRLLAATRQPPSPQRDREIADIETEARNLGLLDVVKATGALRSR